MCFHSQYSYLENFKCSSRATLRCLARGPDVARGPDIAQACRVMCGCVNRRSYILVFKITSYFIYYENPSDWVNGNPALNIKRATVFIHSLIDNPPTKIALNICPQKYKVLSKFLSM